MKLMQRCLRRFGQTLALAIGALVLAGGAQPAAAQSFQGDPPGRVARLADLNGQVWLYTPDAGDWVSAARNRPLTSGDRVATDAGGRAELQIGSTTLRVDASSELEIVRLDDDHVSVQLHSGSVAARLRSAEAAREFLLTTDEGRFRVDAAGRYRFDRVDRASHVTVDRGQAIYEGASSALTVANGQHAEFWIDSAGVAQYSLLEPARDNLTAWAGERDAIYERNPVASRYVSPEMTGAEDLDRYGNWQQSPDYGALWIPRDVSAGWAPYSTGHWAYVRPWGWTWVDDAPWGFAPFHYGRWVYVGNTWGWSPGSRVARPIYAPALVGWIGGSDFNLSLSIGGGGPAVGWFPLAPREVYVPSYGYSPRYVREINITQVTNVTQINNFINLPPERRDFSNRKFPHALTVVPANVVANRQPVGPAAAEVRGKGFFRDFGNQPGRATALLAPPVTAPVAVARPADARSIQPPSGAGRPEARVQRPVAREGQPGGVATAAPGQAVSPSATAPATVRERNDERSLRERGNGRDREDGAGARPVVRPPVAGTAATPIPAVPSPQRPIPPRPGDVTTPPAPPVTRPSPTGQHAPAPPVDERRMAPANGNERRPQVERAEERAPLPGTRNDERRLPLPGVTNDRRLPSARQEERAPLPGTINERRAPPAHVQERQAPPRMEAPSQQPVPLRAVRPEAAMPAAPRQVEAPRPSAPVARQAVPERRERPQDKAQDR